MTPAQLDALLTMHAYVNSSTSEGRSTAAPSTNPAADIAALAAM
jgi:hypothetical protein